jgi:hypothetical protein
VENIHEEVPTSLIAHLEAFRKAGHEASPTFKLWDDFRYKVLRPLKLFIAATRDNVWDVHQCAKSEFLPLLFAANRTNYARFLPILILHQRHLPPSITVPFQDSSFIAKLLPH